MNLASTKAYRQNRARFPVEALRKYNGRWVAFSADGLEIIASGENLAALAEQVRAAGQDMQDVVLERIEMEDREIFLGGAELS
jgi:Family of unknown function (DUF5678)